MALVLESFLPANRGDKPECRECKLKSYHQQQCQGDVMQPGLQGKIQLTIVKPAPVHFQKASMLQECVNFTLVGNINGRTCFLRYMYRQPGLYSSPRHHWEWLLEQSSWSYQPAAHCHWRGCSFLVANIYMYVLLGLDFSESNNCVINRKVIGMQEILLHRLKEDAGV